jgi:hypothetical protein
VHLDRFWIADFANALHCRRIFHSVCLDSKADAHLCCKTDGVTTIGLYCNAKNVSNERHSKPFRNPSDERHSLSNKRRSETPGFTEGLVAKAIALIFGSHHLVVRVKLLPVHHEYARRLGAFGRRQYTVVGRQHRLIVILGRVAVQLEE